MPDDIRRTLDPEDARRPLGQARDLLVWAKQLGVTNEELRSAIESAGAMVKDLRAANHYRDSE
jgi:hypothetical protein